MMPRSDSEAEDAMPNLSMTAPSGNTSSLRRPFDHWNGKPLTQEACTKRNEILAVCEKGQDSGSLVAFATTAGGLVDDEVRRMTCMSIAGRRDNLC